MSGWWENRRTDRNRYRDSFHLTWIQAIIWFPYRPQTTRSIKRKLPFTAAVFLCCPRNPSFVGSWRWLSGPLPTMYQDTFPSFLGSSLGRCGRRQDVTGHGPWFVFLPWFCSLLTILLTETLITTATGCLISDTNGCLWQWWGLTWWMCNQFACLSVCLPLLRPDM